jgi:membrane-bound serine protease (ClpP class)
MKQISFLTSIFILFLLCVSITVSADDSSVLVVEINGTIDQATVEAIFESINVAERQNAEALIIALDTPGGGLQQTFDIADLISASELPVIGYVYPSGATGWSAGTFILLSTHLAAMAPSTVIGSCQPVQITATGTQTINDSKTINALVEWIKERAKMYQRNASLAEDFVRRNTNVNATVAQQAGVIELQAESINELLLIADGLNVTTEAGSTVLQTANATYEWYIPSFRVQVLGFISNPLLTSLLFMLGIFALIFGISAPGYGAEVFGVVAILLSLIGSGFAISELSIIFLIIGVFMLLVEIFIIPGFGFVGIGGIVSLAIGSMFLIPTYTSREWLVEMSVVNDLIIIVLVAVALLALFFLFLLYKIVEVRKKKKAVGVFVGEQAVTVDEISPQKKGYIRFHGELWFAESEMEIMKNMKVVIIGKDGATLKVKPLENTTKH